MPRVTVEPAGFCFEATPETNLLDAATEAGVSWPTICHGQGTCTTCHFLVRAGHEHFSPQANAEREALIMVRRRYPGVAESDVRLACQTRVRGDVTVRCKGARAE